MKRFFRWPLAALLLLCAPTANADSVNFNIHLGDAPQEEVIVVREPAHHHHHHSREIYVEDDVQFICPESLGFYVAVGLPYDLFYVGKTYYLYRDGYWHRAHHSRGPWVVVAHRDLPAGLRKHSMERLRYYRDEEHNAYRRDEENYRGKHFRSAKSEWQDQRWEDNRGEKEERKEHRKEKRRH